MDATLHTISGLFLRTGAIGVVMASRENLHELIDKLPEAALESAERILRNIQTWPPKPPIEVEKMRKRVEERLTKPPEELIARPGGGLIRGQFISCHSTREGDGAALGSTFEGETLVNFEVRLFRGHRLEFEERLRLSDDKRSLLYSQWIKGPEGKEGRYDIEFAVAEGPPS
jgi:hypothetical protein